MFDSLQTSTNLTLHIRSLLSSGSFGDYTSMQISQDCQLMVDFVKVLVYEYYEDHQQTSVSLQLLYEHINDKFYANNYYSVLNMKILAKSHNFFQLVLTPTIDFFGKEWAAHQNSNLLPNLTLATKECVIECLCDSQNILGEVDLQQCQFCYQCGELFHMVCFRKQKENIDYECPQCYLINFMPDRSVKSVLFKSYIQPVSEGETITSVIKVQWQSIQQCNSEYSIQLRCFRIGGDYELTWPEHCNIFFDNEQVSSILPLPSTSPLKRRHDTPLILSMSSLAHSQNIKIQQLYAGCQQWHMITVVAVICRTSTQIYNDYFNDYTNQLSEKESQKYLQRLFQIGTQLNLVVQQIRISSICQFYRGKISIPCRSRHCVTHYQPFDLFSFICSSVTAKTCIKRWKCPICGVRAYDILRDMQLESRLIQNTQKQLSFISNKLPVVNI